MHCLYKAATHTQVKHITAVDMAQPRIEAGRLSMACEELNAVILREGLDMFRQLLARLIPRHRPSRRRATRATEASPHESLCERALGEVYHAHAAMHGPNKLLPGDAFPDPPEHAHTGETGSKPTLA